MKQYLPRPRTIVIDLIATAVAVAVFGAINDALHLALAALFVIAVSLLITAAIEWCNLRPRPKSPNIIAVSVTRNDGRREVVSLNPDDDASIENFTRALEEDIASRTTPEERESLHEYARAKVNRELANANRA